MSTKRKISLTIDEEVAAGLENAAMKYKTSKSRLAQEALKLWLRKQIDSLMAKGYEEMAEEDRAFAEQALEAQKEVRP
jgi:hypothetical protein